MIRYRLRCSHDHEFEAWFASSEAYDAQEAAREIGCPHCGDRDVARAIMAPNVSVRDRGEPGDACERSGPPPRTLELLREVRRTLLSVVEDVGAHFPEEARKIHYGEADARGIRGTASGDEVRTLLDEGIEVIALPSLPEDAN